MAIGNIDVGQELLNVPMGKMILEMAKSIAEAQWELDKSSMTVTELMSGTRVLRDLDTGALVNPMPDGSPRLLDSRVYFGYTYTSATAPDGKQVWTRVPNRVSMMELGFTPTFYQFVDTIIEVKIAIKITGSTEQVTESQSSNQSTAVASSSTTSTQYGGSSYFGFGWSRGSTGSGNSGQVGASRSQRVAVQTSQVDASYSSKYSYSVEGASLLRTKLAPVPPPAILLERIQEVMDEERAFQDRINQQGTQ